MPGKSYSAIVDTGAQNTMVSQKVIQAAGLPQVGHTRVMGITGVMKVAKYRARVDIPVNIGGQNVMASGKEFEVVTMPQNLGKIDVLLGMDFYQDS
ncbi:MAG: retropepsin-like aspartic protease, partial [Rhodobacteraceae bacterium]|nr:retropepsin-like aspartic protease [Paracoccaceae bacterium]